MFKFKNHLLNANLVLVKKQLGEGSCAALIVMKTPRRQHSHGPPPKKSRTLLWSTIGVTMLTGAGVVYAKNNPDVRNWLESNAPLANDFIALVYQENTTYWKFTTTQMGKFGTLITNFMFGKEGITPPDIPGRATQDFKKDQEKRLEQQDYELPPRTFQPLYSEEKKIGTPEVEVKATLVQTEKCEPTKPPEIKITKDLVELEQDMHVNTKVAVENYRKANDACINYNKTLFKVIELPVEELDARFFSSLQQARQEKDDYSKKANAAAAQARCAIETLERLIKAGVQAPPEALASTKRYIKQFKDDLRKYEKAYLDELEKTVLSDRYWDKIHAARMAYKSELESLFPGIDLTARKIELKGDIDLLLLYTYKQIHFLQKEVAELQTIRESQISKAIECHDEKAIIQEKVNELYNKERFEKEQQYMKKIYDIEVAAQKKIDEELRKHYLLQQDVLQARLAKKEKEVLNALSRSISEAVEKERVKYKKELAEMAGRMNAIEQTLKQRAKVENEARRSQSLWIAAEALLAAIRRPQAETKIDNELKALEKAGKEDILVQTVLKGIPKEVREKGIVTERSLQERFARMEKNAVKVALVGHDGASLPVYFLSWLQSKLLFLKVNSIPRDELDNRPTDFCELDTFDIIQRARYYMDRGELTIALKYINLLQGAPRAAAKSWTEAARRHLEIRQAAEAVMAHASVSAL